jgi:hypothetical protein
MEDKNGKKPVPVHGARHRDRHEIMLLGRGLSSEKKLTTRVKEGDSVTIYLPVSGG